MRGLDTQTNTHTHTHRTTTVTLAAHARRGLISMSYGTVKSMCYTGTPYHLICSARHLILQSMHVYIFVRHALLRMRVNVFSVMLFYACAKRRACTCGGGWRLVSLARGSGEVPIVDLF